MQKHCPKCEQDKPIASFGKAKSWCKSCMTQATKDWRNRNRDAVNAQARERYAKQENPPCKQYRTKLREAALAAYGGKCECCNEDRIEFLCIDHQGGGGTKHRKELGRVTIFSWLKKNKYPSGFRVLCWNCNSSLGLYGYSPADRNFK